MEEETTQPNQQQQPQQPQPEPEPDTPIGDRECRIILVCGAQGQGKSYYAHRFIKHYMGRNHLKALVYNINLEETYNDFKDIEINPRPKYSPEDKGDIYIEKKDKKDDIRRKISKWRINTKFKPLRGIRARHVLPLREDKTEMDPEEKKQLLSDILRGYTKGLLVIEDIDNYAARASGQNIIGSMTNVRHRNLDIMIHHQSVSMPSQYEWRNTRHLVLFWTEDSIDDSTTVPVGKRPAIKIGELIIRDQVEHGNKHFCLLINFYGVAKIYGIKKSTFLRAARRYINQNPRMVKLAMKELDPKTGQPKYDLKGAYQKVLNDMTKYYGGLKRDFE